LLIFMGPICVYNLIPRSNQLIPKPQEKVKCCSSNEDLRVMIVTPQKFITKGYEVIA
jgi:hypothetical protein